jgi:N-sulfoglucosamine sulfohydrolase
MQPHQSLKQAALVLLLTCICSLNLWSAEKKPNIVVFIADDHGVLDSSVYGATDIKTPNSERIARQGLVFTRAFVASPSCAPSRAALLTGLMPARNGAEANHSKPRPDIKTLPRYMQELGYEVVSFGKVAHYKHTLDYAFDHFAHDTFHDHRAIPAALKWLTERTSTKPLCLFVGSNWPHVPWPEVPTNKTTSASLPPALIDTKETRHARSAYIAAVERMDAELGQVHDAVTMRLGTNTLFVHTSDHGAQLPFAKWNCYDAGIRTSLLVSWPGMVKPGARTDAMVSWIDLLPTFIEVGGGKAPAEIDGRSFLSVMLSKTNSHRDRIFSTHSADGKMNVYPMRSIRTAQWKYILNLHPEFRFTTHIDREPRVSNAAGYWGSYWQSWRARAATDGSAKQTLQKYHTRPAEELYDLAADPHEMHNLAASPAQAERMHALRGEMKQWMRDQGDNGKVFGTPITNSDP